jgi:glycosyltransferase involved in cell wall biosynthesis
LSDLLGVAFLGGTRYAQPLNPTHAKKFAALSSLGNLHVVGFANGWQFQHFTEHAHFYLLPQLPLSILRYVALLLGGWAIALWLIWQHRVRVFVAQSPYEAVAAAWAKQVGNWFGCKVVLVVESHGDFESYLFLQRSVPFPAVYRWLMRRAARFSLSQADLLRGVSEATCQQLRQWSPDRPIFKFVAWTDIESFLQAYATRSSISSQTVLYAGVMIPRKGVLHLVNAFAQVAENFPHANLVMVGREANATYAAAVQQRVQQLGLGDRVQFLSHRSQAELAEQMAQALVFVLPSLSEGLGLVVVEAMATGTPVIGSAVDGIPEMIQDGSNGFLTPPAAETVLADRLRWCLTHPEETRAMGDRAHQFAQRFFSCAMHVDGYRQVLNAADAILHDRSADHAPSTF